MPDTRLQRMAQVLVRYSLGIRKGDRLAIETGPIVAPLVHEVVREALHAEPTLKPLLLFREYVFLSKIIWNRNY